MEQKPSIGRIVHFKDDRGETNAAIITKVWSDQIVDLAIFQSRIKPENVVNYDAFSSCPFGEGNNQWNWPPKV